MTADGALPAVTLVLGGARSGKSRYAEQRLQTMPGPYIYVATAESGDAEMAERIARHQERRGPSWRTVEEPLELTGTLDLHNGSAILVDCLTLWLSNVMFADRDVEDSISELTQTLRRADGSVVLVSNEVGYGIVPENAIARAFRDYAGWMHQEIAAVAQSVVLVTAGIPQDLKTPERN